MEPIKKEPAKQASSFDFKRTPLYPDGQEQLAERLAAITAQLELAALQIEDITDAVNKIHNNLKAKKMVAQWMQGIAPWRDEDAHQNWMYQQENNYLTSPSA